MIYFNIYSSKFGEKFVLNHENHDLYQELLKLDGVGPVDNRPSTD